MEQVPDLLMLIMTPQPDGKVKFPVYMPRFVESERTQCENMIIIMHNTVIRKYHNNHATLYADPILDSCSITRGREKYVVAAMQAYINQVKPNVKIIWKKDPERHFWRRVFHFIKFWKW